MSDPYRILVTGSRDWDDEQTIWTALAKTVLPIPHDREIVIVHGDCPSGADRIADKWARSYGATVEPHPAKGHPTEDFGDWPAAGPRRNAHMIRLGADVCLAFIGPCTSGRCKRADKHPSHGASGTAQLARAARIPVRRWTA